MKHLHSIEEEKFVELVKVELSKEEQDILFSDASEEIKTPIYERIKNEREKTATKADIKTAISFYKKIKPVIEDDYTYELISFDVTFDSTKASGLLNYRINKEHKQIRF